MERFDGTKHGATSRSVQTVPNNTILERYFPKVKHFVFSYSISKDTPLFGCIILFTGYTALQQ